MFQLKLLDPITPQLILHIAAGGISIGSGVVALLTRKGGVTHRIFGRIFGVSMTIMGVTGAYVALTLSGFSAFPRKGTAIVGVLTANLVASAWLTVRRKPSYIGVAERVSAGINFLCAAIAAVMGVLAITNAQGLFDGIGWKPYTITASGAAFIAALDLRVIRRGGLSGRDRIARHLWRMCFALFLAAAFFFLGQQRIMPTSWQGSPALTAIAIAPLAAMVFWLVRVHFPHWTRSEAK